VQDGLLVFIIHLKAVVSATPIWEICEEKVASREQLQKFVELVHGEGQAHALKGGHVEDAGENVR
jgi:hypothetical protein